MARPYVLEYLPQGLLDKLTALQGRRRRRVLRPEDLAHAIYEADENGWFTSDGGEVANAYKWGSKTTVIVAVRLPDGMVAIDIGSCDGHRPSPGRTWSDLKPWDERHNAFVNRLTTWADAPDRFKADPLLIRP